MASGPLIDTTTISALRPPGPPVSWRELTTFFYFVSSRLLPRKSHFLFCTEAKLENVPKVVIRKGFIVIISRSFHSVFTIGSPIPRDQWVILYGKLARLIEMQ